MKQKYLEEHPKWEHIFQLELHALYDIDILEEDAIMEWKKQQEQLEGHDRRFLNQVRLSSASQIQPIHALAWPLHPFLYFFLI